MLLSFSLLSFDFLFLSGGGLSGCVGGLLVLSGMVLDRDISLAFFSWVCLLKKAKTEAVRFLFRPTSLPTDAYKVTCAGTQVHPGHVRIRGVPRASRGPLSALLMDACASIEGVYVYADVCLSPSVDVCELCISTWRASAGPGVCAKGFLLQSSSSARQQEKREVVVYW